MECRRLSQLDRLGHGVIAEARGGDRVAARRKRDRVEPESIRADDDAQVGHFETSGPQHLVVDGRAYVAGKPHARLLLSEEQSGGEETRRDRQADV